MNLPRWVVEQASNGEWYIYDTDALQARSSEPAFLCSVERETAQQVADLLNILDGLRAAAPDALNPRPDRLNVLWRDDAKAEVLMAARVGSGAVLLVHGRIVGEPGRPVEWSKQTLLEREDALAVGRALAALAGGAQQ